MAPALLTARTQIVSTPEFVRAVDNWRRKQPDLPSRSEAIRRLVEAALAADLKDEAEAKDAAP